MSKRVKAGLVLLSAEWFTQIAYDTTDDATANINDMVQDSAKKAVASISKFYDVVHPEIITSVAQAKDACDEFRKENIDVIILVNLIYSGDDPIIEVVRQMPGIPMLLWSYNVYKKIPRITGMCEYFSVTGAPGMLQGVAPLKRMGVNFGFVLGVPGDERLESELHDWAVALSVRKRMADLNIMSVGRRYEPMSGAWIDELKMKARLGPKMVWISAFEFAQEVKNLDEEMVKKFAEGEKAKYPVKDISDEDIIASAKASIACYNLCKKYNCEVLSFQDMDEEVHDFVGCRPQMTYQPMFDEGISAGMEADIDSALCTWILQNLSEGPSMYGEILTYDEVENFLVIGHASMHDLRLAKEETISLIPDLEFQYADKYKGVWDEFISKPGEVSLVAMFEDNDNYQFVAVTGESLDMPVWVPGYGQALVRTEIPMVNFMKAICEYGVTQHFALCFGNVKPRLEILSKEMGIKYIDLNKQYKLGLI